MTKRLRSIGAALLFAGLSAIVPIRTAFAAASDDAVITVSPIADVSLSLNVTSYAFGPVAVNASTNSATALTLTNNGQVSITVDKRIASDPAGWTAGVATGLDAYILYCATSTTRLALSDYGVATRLGALGNITSLTGPLGTQPVMPPQGAGSSVDLWFRLDMPTQVSSGAAKTITVRFTGTAQ